MFGSIIIIAVQSVFAWNANIFFILKKLFLTSVHQHQNTLKQFKNI
jgi:hypothetical protein